MICLECSDQVHAIIPDKIACVPNSFGLTTGPAKGGNLHPNLRIFCPEGHAYLPLTPGGSCVPCTNPDCARCFRDDLSKCLGCKTDTFLRKGPNDSCISTPCTATQYLTPADGNKCVDFALDGCNKMDQYGWCSRVNGEGCPGGQTYFGGVCCTQSATNRNLSTYPATCMKCHDSCLTCSGTGANQCQSCPAFHGLRLNGTTCEPCTAPNCLKCDSDPNVCEASYTPVGCGVDKCLSGFCSGDGLQCNSGGCETGYYRSAIGLCHICNGGCAACESDAANSCVNCRPNFAIAGTVPNSCTCSSPKFLNRNVFPSICLPCPENCSACSAENFCSSCQSFFKLTPPNCTCQTLNGFRVQTATVCVECSKGCTECQINQGLCSGSTCRAGYVDFPNCTCPTTQGYREEASISQGEPKTCVPCTAGVGCHQCAVNRSICSGCRQNFTLADNGCSCTTTGFGLNTGASPQSCEPCEVQNCEKCQSNKSQCELAGCRPHFTRVDPTTCACLEDNGVFLDPSASPATCSPCHTSCQTCRGPLDTDCLSCKPEFYLSATPVGKCLAKSSPNSNEILENAALTFSLRRLVTKSTSDATYRLHFSDPPIVLKQPLTFDDLDSLVDVTLEGYTQQKDYTKTLTYTKQGSMDFVDIKIYPSASSALKTTTITASIKDPSKVENYWGKRLANGEASTEYIGQSSLLGNFMTGSDAEAATKTSSLIGKTFASASSGLLTLTSVCGITLGMIGRFFQVVEFTGLIGLFNIRFDFIIDTLLKIVQTLGEADFFDLPFENTMKEDVENSIASKWRGKLSEMEKPSWHLMDLGISGTYMYLVYLIYGIILLSGSQSRWRERLRILSITLMQNNVMDQIQLTVVTLSNSSVMPLGTVGRILSYLLSLIFVCLCSYEFIRQYLQIKTLHQIEPDNMTAQENDFSKLYFDGLCQEELRHNWYLRNYNLFFTLKYVAVAVLIVSLQNFQELQIFGSFLIMTGSLIINLLQFRKLKFFNSKMIKTLRMIQDISFTMMLGFVCLLYFGQKPGNLSIGLSTAVVVVFCFLIMANVVLELLILIRELIGRCCAKKRLVLSEARGRPISVKISKSSKLEEQSKIQHEFSDLSHLSLNHIDSDRESRKDLDPGVSNILQVIEVSVRHSTGVRSQGSNQQLENQPIKQDLVLVERKVVTIKQPLEDPKISNQSIMEPINADMENSELKLDESAINRNGLLEEDLGSILVDTTPQDVSQRSKNSDRDNLKERTSKNSNVADRPARTYINIQVPRARTHSLNNLLGSKQKLQKDGQFSMMDLSFKGQQLKHQQLQHKS